jgi:hypothetical protein
MRKKKKGTFNYIIHYIIFKDSNLDTGFSLLMVPLYFD